MGGCYCYYSFRTVCILIGMIVTGACRSVGVKILYQLDLINHSSIVLLYLLGQTLSLIVYGIQQQLVLLDASAIRKKKSSDSHIEYEILNNNLDDDNSDDVGYYDQDETVISRIRTNNNGNNHNDDGAANPQDIDYDEQHHRNHLPHREGENGDIEFMTLKKKDSNIVTQDDDDDYDEHHPEQQEDTSLDVVTMLDGLEYEDPGNYTGALPNHNATRVPKQQQQPQRKRRRGSNHGLTSESTIATRWVHRIPYYIKPVCSGFFNFINAILRWACYIYTPASIADMLISGSELVLSVIAARFIRKRLVSSNRWIAVIIVSFGLLLVGFVHIYFFTSNKSISSSLELDENSTEQQKQEQEATNDSILKNDLREQKQRQQYDHWIGNLLVLGQSIMSVLQDISEELFLQETEFPPTLLLGLEGLYGLILGGLCYAVYSLVLGSSTTLVVGTAIIPDATTTDEDVNDGLDDGGDEEVSSPIYSLYLLMVIWFLITGIFNILMTDATSSMTRNVWKNVRILVVWVLGLMLYYTTSSSNSTTIRIGEGWMTPQSYVILLGYMIIVLGIYFYYK